MSCCVFVLVATNRILRDARHCLAATAMISRLRARVSTSTWRCFPRHTLEGAFVACAFGCAVFGVIELLLASIRMKKQFDRSPTWLLLKLPGSPSESHGRLHILPHGKSQCVPLSALPSDRHRSTRCTRTCHCGVVVPGVRRSLTYGATWFQVQVCAYAPASFAACYMVPGEVSVASEGRGLGWWDGWLGWLRVQRS